MNIRQHKTYINHSLSRKKLSKSHTRNSEGLHTDDKEKNILVIVFRFYLLSMKQ